MLASNHLDINHIRQQFKYSYAAVEHSQIEAQLKLRYENLISSDINDKTILSFSNDPFIINHFLFNLNLNITIEKKIQVFEATQLKRLNKQFSVSTTIKDNFYVEATNNKSSFPLTNTEQYKTLALLAITLTSYYSNISNNLNYLNTAIKINDLLIYLYRKNFTSVEKILSLSLYQEKKIIYLLYEN